MPYAARSPAQIFEKTPEKVKNFGIWFRYDSRTGTHNAYKEYREVSLTNAVNSLYQNMAGLSRAKAASIQILKTSELKPEECKRPNVKQFHVRSSPLPACALSAASGASLWSPRAGQASLFGMLTLPCARPLATAGPEGQVPAAAPRRQDAQDVPHYVQGVDGQDLLRLDCLLVCVCTILRCDGNR